MSIKLPPVIERFLQAKNAYDSAAFIACFSDDAVVRDEGRDMRGKAAIQQWIEDSNAKYQDTVTAQSLADHDGEAVLTARVSGNFEGSPVLLDFIFTITQDKISALRIELTAE